MTWNLRLDSTNSNYVSELELMSGEYPILKLHNGVLEIAVHPEEIHFLLDDLGPLPKEGAKMVFDMHPVGTHGLDKVIEIKYMPDLEHYMLGYIYSDVLHMAAVSIPPHRE